MKENKQRIIAEFFYIHETVVSRHISKGIPFKRIFEMFNDNGKTRKQKKCFLYNLPRRLISTDMKDNIWNRFMGDKWFMNTVAYDSQYKGTVEELLGD